ncbi:hypothetical protein C4D60_Mb03t08360 [Musa balbisiana]|uniref:NAD kinase 1 n=1 Tax=Musa balbisiana TaxID=52838 RepID=A0A4S8J8I4_MUSBA|nr:hypothetical protein C4D60_Mb03t08360 [Musa balbisiana]
MYEPPIKATDDHLVEFSEAMRTVAKALRRAAEAKAAAQVEAAEWKRKYELERASNLRNSHDGATFEGSLCDSGEGRLKNSCDVTKVDNPAIEQSERCCRKHGICSHEILQDEATDTNYKFAGRKVTRKASFRLSWGCNGDKSGQQKHEVVSFERGDITTAERSSKQILLKWETHPHTVLILTKPNSNSVRILCAEMVRWLKNRKKIDVFVEPRVRTELLNEASCFEFVQTWENDEEIKHLHSKVDLVVTLGGDGTVLWCHVIREAAKDELDTEEPILVLNEVTIDRGMSSYLTFLECYCDSSFVTCVQGDGLILSTTSGSTAYSLAAGGSMVHPQVPGILFTPICPHSLSFRPLIFPEYVTIRVQVPFNSRGHAWASFDGKGRKQLAPGDALICSMATWPVPTACLVDSTNDFLRSIHEGLHWNLRKSQSFDGPRDG